MYHEPISETEKKELADHLYKFQYRQEVKRTIIFYVIVFVIFFTLGIIVGSQLWG